MAELSEITALRQIRLDIRRHRKAIAELEKKMDELLEVSSSARPLRRKNDKCVRCGGPHPGR